MDYFTAISTSSFQDPPPPAASNVRGDSASVGANSFDKHLSDNLNQNAQSADKPLPAKNRPDNNPNTANNPSDTPSKPAAPKPMAAAQAQDKPVAPDAPENPDASEKIDINDTAGQNLTTLGQNLKAAIVAAKALSSDATATNAANQPTDLTPELIAALTPAPPQQPAGLIASASAGQKATKASADQKADDTSQAAATAVNGLALGAIGLSVPAIIQSLQQPAPSPESLAAAQASAVNPLPGISGELLAEAAKLLKNAPATAASDASADPAATDAQSDQPKAEGAPVPFAALLSAAKAGTVKQTQATPENSIPSSSAIKLDMPAPMPTGAPLASAKAEAPAPKAESIAKPDAAASLTAISQVVQPGNTTNKGPSTQGADNPATLQATETAAADPLSAASGP